MDANPYAAMAAMFGGTEKRGPEIAMGPITGVSPLRVRVGEMDYEADDITLCTHVSLPQFPTGRLLLVSMDEGQTYYAIGRC